MKKKTTLSLKLLLPLAVAGFAMPASAQEDPQPVSWINSGGGEFHDPANWDGEAVPGQEDPAAFNDIDAAYEVQFTEDAGIAELVNRGGDVTFDLGGNALNVDGRVNLDAAGSGGESIFRNGNITSGQISLGGEGEEGFGRSMVLEGPLLWETDAHVGIGSNQAYDGPSTSNYSLTVRDGAQVNIAGPGNGGGVIVGWGNGSSNSFRVIGPGSKVSAINHVYIGYVGAGSNNSVHVEDGGQLSANGILVGQRDHMESLLVIDGVDTRVEGAFMQIGAQNSTGKMVEQRGGRIVLHPDPGTYPNAHVLS